MNFLTRRDFAVKSFALVLGGAAATMVGCRSHQKARVKGLNEEDRVGSHKAGAEVFNPVVASVVAKMIARVEAECYDPQVFAQMQGDDFMPQMPKKRITFISIENRSAEELGDFKDHIKEVIIQKIGESPAFEIVSDKAVSAALRQTGLKPEDLFVQTHLKHFRNQLGALGEFDYLLYAKLTSGTTQDNKDMQRDYLLTLTLHNVIDFSEMSVSEPISKEYLKSAKGRIGSWFK